MTFSTPVLGRAAILALTLTATGCASSPLESLTALLQPDAAQAAAVAPAPPAPPPARETVEDAAIDAAVRPGNSEIAVAAEAMGGAGDRIAMLPTGRVGPRARKPAPQAEPVCGEVAPGGRAMGTMESGGVRFTVECFRAKTARPGPAVIILHGARGIGRNTIYERLALELAERGQSSFVLQYLSGQEPPPVPAKQAAAKTGATKAAAAKPAQRKRGVDSAAQIKAIENAVTAVQSLAYVDHERIGLFGLSLGGFHALAIASRDPRIGAVVDMFGGMPRPVEPTVERMPPTLVLHGDRDAVVPVKRAHELAKLLKTVGAVHEVKIYKGQGHSFTGAADQDSIERTVEFLARHLGERTAREG